MRRIPPIYIKFQRGHGGCFLFSTRTCPRDFIIHKHFLFFVFCAERRASGLDIATKATSRPRFRPSRELVVIHGFSRAYNAKKGAEDDILRRAQSFGARYRNESNFSSPFPPLARTRGNSRILTSLQRQKTHQTSWCVFWRRRRDSNSCYGFPYYSLSRGAP